MNKIVLNKTPLISIIIPCYNQSYYLEDALQSVYEQTYNNWECIVINDGSIDRTKEIAEHWELKDKRIKYFYKENGGLSSARNLGLDKALGHFIQFLDADDYLENTKLATSLLKTQSIKEEGDKIIISNFRMFTDNPSKSTMPYCQLDKNLFNYKSVLYQWDDGFSIPIHCGLFSTALFDNFRFPEMLNAKEDWVMWVHLFKTDPYVVFINSPLALYRKNNEGMTRTKNMMPDMLKAYIHFKDNLPEEQFHKLSVTLISRYYENASFLKKNIRDLKAIPYVRFGIFLRRGLKKLGILKPFKKLLP